MNWFKEQYNEFVRKVRMRAAELSGETNSREYMIDKLGDLLVAEAIQDFMDKEQLKKESKNE